MTPLNALALLERYLRTMNLPAEGHEQIRAALELIFKELNKKPDTVNEGE